MLLAANKIELPCPAALSEGFSAGMVRSLNMTYRHTPLLGAVLLRLMAK